MAIKLIGLDLDGTALNNNSKFSERTLSAFRRAKEKGAHIIVATGRALQSIPRELYDINELEYVVTSNGARVIRLKDNKTLYLNCIDESAMEDIYKLLVEEKSTIEVFVDGNAYISSQEYEDIMSGRITHRNKEYVKMSRTPTDNIYELLIKHKGEVENINVNYTNMEDRLRMEEKLKGIKNVTLTSSLPFNNELGGITTNKGDGLRFLANMLGVKEDEMLCCGDNPNDISMIEMAKIGVAMGNADDEVKDIADFVTLTNEEDGVAYAIEKFVL